MQRDPAGGRLPPSHSVPKGDVAPRNRKAFLILAALAFAALLIGAFTSIGHEDADQAALEGRPAPARTND